MKTNSKYKLLFTTIMLAALLVCSAYAALMPNVHAAEISVQQKGLAVSSDVLGFDLGKYNVTTKEYPQTSAMSYLDVVPQNSVEYTLKSEEGNTRLFYTFANSKLQMLEVLENDRTQSAKFGVRDVFAANEFLSNYQAYTADPLYGQLRSMIDKVDKAENFTKGSTNITLEATFAEDCTTFKWYYTSNGAIAPNSKFISIIVKDGFLAAFVDNWQLYNVDSTNVKLSKEEAIATALHTAKNHAWSLNIDDSSLNAKNFNESNVRWTALLFDGSLNADNKRSEDPLALYPVWRVGIALDKWYGYMYGVQVDIWADTGEVRRVQEAWSTMPPPEGVPTTDLNEQEALSEADVNMAMLILLPACVIVAGMFALVWIGGKKKVLHYELIKKHRGFKAGGIILCILILSTVFLGSLSTVSATTRGAVVWGSESTGAGEYVPYPGEWTNWRKSRDEIDAQRDTAGNLTVFFDAGGYTGNNGINHQGINNPGSSKNQILNDISTLQYYNDYLAVVDFDHGVGRSDYSLAPSGEWHYMFEDNTGTLIGENSSDPEKHPDNGVYDMDIGSYVNPGQLIFAFISTCKSADLDNGQGNLVYPPFPPPHDIRALGMPFAWTKRYVVDKSARQDFTIEEHISDNGYADPDWGRQVYIGFIGGSASLSQPLGPDDNPYYYWVCSFLGHAMYNDQSVIEALNTASVQFMGSWFSGTELCTGFTPYWWPLEGQWPTSYMAVYGNGNMHLSYYTAPADVATPQYVSGPEFADIDAPCEFSGFATNPYAHDVQYRFDWDDGSNYNETGWYSDGEVASVTHSWSSAGPYDVRIQARCPSSGWSNWSSPYTIYVGETYQLTMLAIDNYGQPGYVPLYIDNEYVGYTGETYTVYEGNHQIGVQSPIFDGHWHEFACYYIEGDYDYDNPMTLSVTEDKTVYACYYTYW
jgi:hypothetical protein